VEQAHLGESGNETASRGVILGGATSAGIGSSPGFFGKARRRDEALRLMGLGPGSLKITDLRHGRRVRRRPAARPHGEVACDRRAAAVRDRNRDRDHDVYSNRWPRVEDHGLARCAHPPPDRKQAWQARVDRIGIVSRAHDLRSGHAAGEEETPASLRRASVRAGQARLRRGVELPANNSRRPWRSRARRTHRYQGAQNGFSMPSRVTGSSLPRVP